jgi:hypothetical protein
MINVIDRYRYNIKECEERRVLKKKKKNRMGS